jgi:hypothetical protein
MFAPKSTGLLTGRSARYTAKATQRMTPSSTGNQANLQCCPAPISLARIALADLPVVHRDDPGECAADIAAATAMSGDVKPSINGGAARRHGGSVPRHVGAVLTAPGDPLDASERAFLEPRFGHDLSAVRIHHDVAAERSAKQLGSLAHAAGPNIVFALGRYAPGSIQGRKLLAHEIAHVLQQGEQGVVAIQRQPAPLAGILDEDEPAIVTTHQIEAKIAPLLVRPTSQAAQARRDYNVSFKIAKSNLDHSHFQTDADRISYAIGYLQSVLTESQGGVDPEELHILLLQSRPAPRWVPRSDVESAPLCAATQLWTARV